MHVEILSFMSFCGRLLSGKAPFPSIFSISALISLTRHRIRPDSQETRHVPILVPFPIQLDLPARPNMRRQHRQSTRPWLNLWSYRVSLRLPIRSIPSTHCRDLWRGRPEPELGLHDPCTYSLWKYLQPCLWPHIRPTFDHLAGWDARL